MHVSAIKQRYCRTRAMHFFVELRRAFFIVHVIAKLWNKKKYET